MNDVVIGLGSNIDPETNIRKSLDALADEFGEIKKSQFIQTKPIGFADQDDFINGSVLVKTDLDIEALNAKLKELENVLGRTKSAIKFGPRVIDLDIVVFNGKVIDQDFYARDFLKNAALELCPDLMY